MSQTITLEKYLLIKDCEFQMNSKLSQMIHSNTFFISVVTGVRFTKRNQTLFLQVQVGKLIEHGTVNLTTIHWKSLPKPEEIFINEIVTLLGNITFDENCYFDKDVITGKIKINKHITIL